MTRAFRYGSGGSYGRPGVPGQPVRNTGRPTSAVAAVAASLKRFGWQQAIVTDPKGVIVVGHTRRLAALKLGWKTAPVVTIPSRQARAYRLVDNRTSELTSLDTDLLPDELAGLNDLDIFSFDDVLPPAATAGKTDPDDIPETPKNPITHKGDLWVLGKHRLMCGDATKPEHVERLLDGAEPDLMVTDPPYGVNYDSMWRYTTGISTKGIATGKSTGCVRQVVQFQIHGCGCDRLGGGPQFFLLFFQKLHIQVAMILEPALVGFGTEGSDQT